MPAAVTIVIIVVLAVVVFVVVRRRGAEPTSEPAATTEPTVWRAATPVVSSFHVKGDTASTVFAVPLGDAEVGDRLVELLSASAVEYVRERVNDGFPLEEVHRIEVSAMRGDTPEVVGTVELPERGVLPDRDDRVLDGPAGDPISAMRAVVADAEVAAPADASTRLEPVAELIVLSGPADARLRSIGVDPGTMSLEDLVLGLLRVSGYDVRADKSGVSVGGGKADVYGLVRDGRQTLLVILAHDPGSHPELEESVLAQFAAAVAQSRPDQAILVTDMYSPYSMYEREKRDKRSAFITRERLQAFVDSFGLT